MGLSRKQKTEIEFIEGQRKAGVVNYVSDGTRLEVQLAPPVAELAHRPSQDVSPEMQRAIDEARNGDPMSDPATYSAGLPGFRRHEHGEA